MPYTSRQRRLFHTISEDPEVAREHGVSTSTGRRLANEADDLARQGRERKPVKKPALKSFLDLGPIFDRPDA